MSRRLLVQTRSSLAFSDTVTVTGTPPAPAVAKYVLEGALRGRGSNNITSSGSLQGADHELIVNLKSGLLWLR